MFQGTDALARATNITSHVVARERRTDFRQHHPEATEIRSAE